MLVSLKTCGCLELASGLTSELLREFLILRLVTFRVKLLRRALSQYFLNSALEYRGSPCPSSFKTAIALGFLSSISLYTLFQASAFRVSQENDPPNIVCSSGEHNDVDRS